MSAVVEKNSWSDVGQFLAPAGAFIAWLLSWAPLSALSLLISGKLLARRIQLGIGEKDFLDFHLGMMRVHASGDAISLGLFLFVMMMGAVSVVFGSGTALFVKSKLGLDIGVWNSVCLVSAFFSLMSSGLIFALYPIFIVPGGLSKRERQDQIQKLGESDD